jgi:pimeloyl-ACP methyl ester carboxylesterase
MDFALPDGRVLGWAEYGDQVGSPVVYLHGTPGSRLSRPDDTALEGIRLITLDRPGYGRSTPVRRPRLLGEDPVMRHRQLLADGKDRWMPPDEDSNREGARQGAAGLVNDWLATDLRSWGFRLRDVPSRVLVWAGRQDASRAVPDAPLIAARLPDAEVRISEDAGHTPSPADWRDLLAWSTASPNGTKTCGAQ